jgi:hypothetical protein
MIVCVKNAKRLSGTTVYCELSAFLEVWLPVFLIVGTGWK